MIYKNDKNISPEVTSTIEDDIDDLKKLVKKINNQNEALTELLTKLNIDSNHSINKFQ